MFEQSYSDQLPTESARQEDLFYNYEIPSWELTPRIYKILVASMAVNLLALTIFGQAWFLTAKGCDSPLVGRVCQVLDTVYVGALLFGSEREYVDVAYDPTRMGADDEVVFVDVSNLEAKLAYPNSFVDMTNGQTVPMFGQPAVVMSFDQSFIAPGIPRNPVASTPSLIDTPQVLPKPTDNPIIGDLPTFGDTTTTPTRKNRGGRIRNKPSDSSVASEDANANTTVNPTIYPNAANANSAQPDEASQDKFGVFINKRPLKDRAKETIEQVNANKVKLDSTFKVVIAGTLGVGKDGKTVVLKNPKPIPVDKNIQNDPAMVKLAQDWILAVGDAGWLGYLDRFDDKKVKSRKVVISIEQNDTDFVASVRTEQPTENDARTASSGLNGILGLAAPAATGDEQTFLKAASSTSDGNFVILNINIPKALVQEMIQRKLTESKEPTQPNSNAIAGPNNNSAAK